MHALRQAQRSLGSVGPQSEGRKDVSDASNPKPRPNRKREPIMRRRGQLMRKQPPDEPLSRLTAPHRPCPVNDFPQRLGDTAHTESIDRDGISHVQEWTVVGAVALVIAFAVLVAVNGLATAPAPSRNVSTMMHGHR
ncbi:hypothetical protein GCM10011594_31500 [Nakamurella endophytica]|uniref:Uncharacterized protein n=1 Tax=Nakamurella endophytica TaxID=1748367 RepID=A0A917T3T9_9ACTN|nr:hypothetical protein GCM10011594_31500 [Nakamurella endophytica]